MCFGSKETANGNGDQAPRPASSQAPQRNSISKASVPQKAYQPPQQPQYHQPHQSAQNDYAPPAGPPPGFPMQQRSDFQAPPGPPPGPRPNEEYAPPPGPPPSGPRPSANGEDYAPPPGPPPPGPRPDVGGEDYAPPPGPPPPGLRPGDDFAPPPGPPPGSRPPNNHQYEDFAPLPGPPPTSKPAHDWETAVPDTSKLPPPPNFFAAYDKSYTSNATEEDANDAAAWCQARPLMDPITLDPQAQHNHRTHNVALSPPQVPGLQVTLANPVPGVWTGQTRLHNRDKTDSCIIGYPPLYAVREDSPLIQGHGTKIIYYEVNIANDFMDPEVPLAIGFTAIPYPPFRMPGWHRGSLAVHGDDGRKYINDMWGGKDCTMPFRRGETYGVGMVFKAVGGRLNVKVFYTREGQLTGSWDLHEESDQQEDLAVTGLEGFHDLSCAIGTCDNISYEIVFDPTRWKYNAYCPQIEYL